MPAHRGSQAGEYRYADVDVRLFDAALGAEVRCGDLRHLSDAQFEQIRAAWLDHLVLVFRGQSLTDDDLIALGRRFGEIDDTVRPQPTDQPGQPSRQLALTIVSMTGRPRAFTRPTGIMPHLARVRPSLSNKTTS